MNRLLAVTIVCAGILFVNGFAVTTIAGAGDSNTDGSALPTAGETGDTTNVWTAFLAKKLGSQYQVGNFGLGGTTILRSGDFPYINQPPFASVFSFKPDIVIINLGTNDTKPFNYVYVNQLAGDLEFMIDSFLTMTPKPTIYGRRISGRDAEESALFKAAFRIYLLFGH